MSKAPHPSMMQFSKNEQEQMRRRRNRLRSFWSETERARRLELHPELQLGQTILAGRIETLCNAGAGIDALRRLIPEARLCLAWLFEQKLPLLLTFRDIAAGFDIDRVEFRGKILALIKPHDLACLKREKPFFCPICGCCSDRSPRLEGENKPDAEK